MFFGFACKVIFTSSGNKEVTPSGATISKTKGLIPRLESAMSLCGMGDLII